MSSSVRDLSDEQLLRGLRTGALKIHDSEVREAASRLDVGKLIGRAGTDEMARKLLLSFPEEVVAHVNEHGFPGQRWDQDRQDFTRWMTALLTGRTRRQDEAAARACMKWFDHLVFDCPSPTTFRDSPASNDPTWWARDNIEIMFPDLFARLCIADAWQDEELVWQYVQLAISIIMHEYSFTNRTVTWNRNGYTRNGKSLTAAAGHAKLALETSVGNPVVRKQLLQYMTGSEMAENRHRSHFEALRKFLWKIVEPSKEELINTL